VTDDLPTDNDVTVAVDSPVGRNFVDARFVQSLAAGNAHIAVIIGIRLALRRGRSGSTRGR
jgi:hypothetical protein